MTRLHKILTFVFIYAGHKPRSVPLWEREFCSYVGNISWQRFCENKRYVSIFPDLEQWDDSGAFENFQNAKARFWANYHGQHSDIPLPDPDMYIDKVDHHCKVDPELVADLDKVRLPIDPDNNSVMATGSADAGADNMCTQNQSGDWDICIEKPAEVDEWNWEPSPGSNATWGGNNESSSKWGTINFCWGASLEEPSWHSWSNDHYASNNRYNNLYGSSNNNRYQEPGGGSKSHIRKDNNGSGHFHQKNKKLRNKDEVFGRSSWKDPRGRKKEWHPVHNRTCQSGQGIEDGP
ncbi:hypothetical protein PAHAL_8G223800 [Panicum hallii]|jgi:hypothetical protein|uniref:Uncharacterized protein n=1 Tax=Panicum hallii TaxID=206008 RepID=A0A2T8I9Z2_9POAL|nr:hypothetical protein PAHAL_8G223800 [Panicum hallii]